MRKNKYCCPLSQVTIWSFASIPGREHLDRILHKVGSDYKMFCVEQGAVSEMAESQALNDEESEG